MPADQSYRAPSDRYFHFGLFLFAGTYLALIVLMVAATLVYDPIEHVTLLPADFSRPAPSVPTFALQVGEHVSHWSISQSFNAESYDQLIDMTADGQWLQHGRLALPGAAEPLSLTPLASDAIESTRDAVYINLEHFRGAQPGRVVVLAAMIDVPANLQTMVRLRGGPFVRFWVGGVELHHRMGLTMPPGAYPLVALARLPAVGDGSGAAEFAFSFDRRQNPIMAALSSREIRYATLLSVVSCTICAILSLWVAVPIGYIMSRFAFPGKNVIDTILDIPIVLPPLVVGTCLLILFNFAPFAWVSGWVVYEIPAVIIAQFTVSGAFAVRTMRVTFDQIAVRYEQVAMTLGSSRSQAFWMVVLPQARRGMFAAGALAWARALGEFGPILVFAGATPLRTEVLPTSVYLQLQAGNTGGMLAVSIIMIGLAAFALIAARVLGVGRLNV